MAEVLRQKGIHVSGGNAVSATFVKSSADTPGKYQMFTSSNFVLT